MSGSGLLFVQAEAAVQRGTNWRIGMNVDRRVLRSRSGGCKVEGRTQTEGQAR